MRGSTAVKDNVAAAGQAVVYFIHAGDRIKIGRTEHIYDRFVTVCATIPGECFLMALLPGGQAEERALHERFGHLCIHSEWFRPDAELLSFIEKIDCDIALPDLRKPEALVGNGGNMEQRIAYTAIEAAGLLCITPQQIHNYAANGAAGRGRYQLDEYKQANLTTGRTLYVTAESVERLKRERAGSKE